MLTTVLMSVTPIGFGAEANDTSDNSAAVVNEAPPTHNCLQGDSEQETQFANWQAQQLPVGEIRIDQRPIFNEDDPDENNWLFRGVNSLHVNTRHHIIREDLLFKSGQPFDANKVIESERILRRRPYVREPRITPMGDCKDRVDLNVQFHEVWTLMPQVSYSHKGGQSNSSLGIADRNFFGSGKEVSIQSEKTQEYNRRYIAYRDPNWGNMRGTLTAQFGETAEGQFHRVDLDRPFYALDTKWASGVYHYHQIQTGALYYRGDKIQQYEQERTDAHVYYGFSEGLQNQQVSRWFVGIEQEITEFNPNDDTVPDIELPSNRRYIYPYLAWEWIDTDYFKAVNVNQINLTEDYNAGWQFNAKVGLSDDRFSDAQHAIVAELSTEKATLLGQDKLLYLQLAGNGKYQDQEWRNGIVAGVLRYHQGNFETSQFYMGLFARYGINLDIDKYIYLGGDNGLRGYPLRYQVGDRSMLLNTEWRLFTHYEVFKLADVGFAFFHDIGRAWFGDHDNGQYGGWLQDVGFGLRLSPTRIGETRHGGGTVIHIDLAFPLDARDDVGRYQWLVQAKQSF